MPRLRGVRLSSRAADGNQPWPGAPWSEVSWALEPSCQGSTAEPPGLQAQREAAPLNKAPAEQLKPPNVLLQLLSRGKARGINRPVSATHKP